MSQYTISMNGEELETVKDFRYLRVKFSKNGNGEAAAESRFMQGKNIGVALKDLVNEKK